MDSPFDLSSFIAYPNTAGSSVNQHPQGAASPPPPASTAGGNKGDDQGQKFAGGVVGPRSTGGGSASGPQPQHHPQRQGPAESPELYNAFAAGIRATAKQAGQVNGNKLVGMSLNPGGKLQQLQQGTYGVGSDRKDQGSTSNDKQTDLLTLLPPNANPSASTTSSSANETPNATPRSFPNINLSPYGLDPSAFQSEVRFQLPAFLNPTNGVPTQGGGAEAFSGYTIGQGAMDSLFGVGAGGSVGMGMGTSSSSAGMGLPMNSPWTQNGMGTYGGEAAQGFNKWENQAYTGKPYDQWGSSNDVGQSFGYPAQTNNSVQQQQNNYLQTTFGGVANAQQDPTSTDVDALLRQLNDAGTSSDTFGHARTSSMPTSALLPSSFYPSSSAFASSSTMAFPNLDAQSVLANATADLTASMPLPAMSADNVAGPSQPALGNLPGLYSTSGFDMVGILARVAARRDPKTVLGPIDCSCSFLVVDVRKYDHPIVYASPTFTSLTGYETHEIIGKNCRFLQSPNGEVVKGSRRKYTDNVAVAHIKRLLGAGKECQASLINYRKGGTPFINLVTVVPIPWDTDEIVYHVGFQVDLVEQPNAILRNMRDGSYQVNYTVAPSPLAGLTIKPPPLKVLDVPANVMGGLKPELYDLLGHRERNAIANGGEDSGNLEWLKFALDHSDDFVHVVSARGQFQYVSASVQRVLEYEPDDLLNKYISDICHPSDIVPVMREIKDSMQLPTDGQLARTVNLVFRVRRKKTGYIWMECTGRLHFDTGKGRKALILAGRQRTVPSVSWGTIGNSGGLSPNEIWAKLSFDGLILWMLGATQSLFGSASEDMTGRSFYSLLTSGQAAAPKPDGDKAALAFERALLAAADGLPKSGSSSVNHRVQKADGTTGEVITTFFATGASVLDGASDEGYSPNSTESDNGNLPLSALTPRRSEILVHLKLAGAAKRPNVHPASESVFEEMDTTRGTSWQYEMQQLRLANRKLRDEIDAAKNRKGVATGSSRKRKADDVGGGRVNMGAVNAKVDHAAPPHQQTPGYGLAPAEVYGAWH